MKYPGHAGLMAVILWEFIVGVYFAASLILINRLNQNPAKETGPLSGLIIQGAVKPRFFEWPIIERIRENFGIIAPHIAHVVARKAAVLPSGRYMSWVSRP